MAATRVSNSPIKAVPGLKFGEDGSVESCEPDMLTSGLWGEVLLPYMTAIAPDVATTTAARRSGTQSSLKSLTVTTYAKNAFEFQRAVTSVRLCVIVS